ncbi:hypothetical protein TNCV_4652981 [Trichonephila clavipes]|nr:hypothetical protein TNCV_4652981 [Trichonephila clavipes]
MSLAVAIIRSRSKGLEAEPKITYVHKLCSRRQAKEMSSEREKLTLFSTESGARILSKRSVLFESLRAMPLGKLRAEIGEVFFLNALAVPQRETFKIHASKLRLLACRRSSNYNDLPNMKTQRSAMSLKRLLPEIRD